MSSIRDGAHYDQLNQQHYTATQWNVAKLHVGAEKIL